MLDNGVTEIGGVAGEQLMAIINRIENLEEEKAKIQEDIKKIKDEAKGNGFDVKIIAQLLQLRKMDEEDRNEKEDLLHTYMAAIGMAR
jgi:uncharacterized protein (UPF0335 family)